jgi:hypothetical protein
MGFTRGLPDPPARAGQSDQPPPDRDKDPDDDTPETPLDEPQPPRVDDPPPEPDRKGPYVVRGHRTEAQR